MIIDLTEAERELLLDVLADARPFSGPDVQTMRDIRAKLAAKPTPTAEKKEGSQGT